MSAFFFKYWNIRSVAAVLLLTVTALIVSCKPPTFSGRKKVAQANDSATVMAPQNSSFSSRIGNFDDTTLITIENAPPRRIPTFAQALREFDLNNYQKASTMFLALSAKLPASDTLKCESSYMFGESQLQLNRFPEAENAFLNLLKNKTINQSVKERLYHRLGQISCIKKDSITAESYFNTLRSEFPDSKLLPISNCDFMKK